MHEALIVGIDVRPPQRLGELVSRQVAAALERARRVRQRAAGGRGAPRPVELPVDAQVNRRAGE
jgi:hypothetical protein